MALDKRGDIAIAILVIYIPFLAISLGLVLRHGFSRRAGWLLLLIFSIIRIVGSAIHIASEERSTPSVGLIATYITLESAGLSPLLIATLGFLSTVAQRALDRPIVTRGLRLLGLLGTIALALAIAAGSILGSASTQSDVNQGNSLRHASVILFAVLYASIVLTHLYFYTAFQNILPHRRKLLIGITAVLPFLLVRVVYSVLSGFAPSGIVPNGLQPAHNSLSKFSSQTGSWVIYLVMSILMEIIVMIIYAIVGLSIRLQDDDIIDEKPTTYSNNTASDVEMNPGRNGYKNDGRYRGWRPIRRLRERYMR